VKQEIRRIAMALFPRILAESHFKTDKEGWSHVGDCTLTHSPTGGNPGGCLKAVDRGLSVIFYYVAPIKFLGDKQPASRLEYDIKFEAGNLPLIDDWEVKLAGQGTALVYRPGPPPPPRNQWFHRLVPLRRVTGWTNVTKNRPATIQDLKLVLTRLERLAIRGEFVTGADTGYLDNVVLYSSEVLWDEEP
jgi:alkaline phosphatase D